MTMTKDIGTWMKFLKKNFAVVEERCYKGIPASVRGRAWIYLSTADEYKSKSENYDFMVCLPYFVLFVRLFFFFA